MVIIREIVQEEGSIWEISAQVFWKPKTVLENEI